MADLTGQESVSQPLNSLKEALVCAPILGYLNLKDIFTLDTETSGRANVPNCCC